MKSYIFILFFLVLCLIVIAQNKSTGDNRTVVVKSEGWNRNDTDNSSQSPSVTVDGVTYIPKQDGILITLPRASNNVKLLAMTGEVVWSGDLVQGKFFIPTRPGIYFLRINNKSYKVVCK
jgi:hypothetical protein